MCNVKRIFTFWEPKDKMAEYIKLCIRSWRKFLPEYEIIILDYSNLSQWMPENYYDNYLYKNFSLPIQADAIRCAVLGLHGGIWMDADTIITSSNVESLFNVDAKFVLVNDDIGFIKAEKDSVILRQWQRYIFKKIQLHKKYRNVLTYIFNYKFFRKFKNWAYLGNSIINHQITNKSKEEFYSIPLIDNYIMPEKNYELENKLELSVVKNYQNFYFYNDFSEYVGKHNNGIIMLHNSWTPKEYRKKNILDFKNTLSSILQKFAD